MQKDDVIYKQAAIDAIKKHYRAHDNDLLELIAFDIEQLPPAQPEQRCTKEELRVFQHGISLSLLSKRSSQHWQYDENTATEIKFLERLYEKVGADMRGEYANIVKELEKLPSAQRTGRWSGLWSEPQDDNSIYGEKLMEGDTIYLLGVEGVVKQEYGAWGWASVEYVPWEKLEEKMPHGNRPNFCYCDNFVSFWELKWAFDDGSDWDGVPFIRHGARMDGE